MTEAEEWKAFDPGFDYGKVDLRAANVQGVFRADKLTDMQDTDVRVANCQGQIGEESFDWSTVDTQGADVRKANCSGQIGSENFDWSAVTTGDEVRKANCPSQIDANAFDGMDLGNADVRKPNCPGQIGDENFNKLLATQQTKLSSMQALWRSAVPSIAIVPFGLAASAITFNPGKWYIGASVAASLGLVGVVVVRKLLNRILMVKQGTLCFAQFFENGTTHVLQAGVQPIASFGTTTQTFEVKQDQMCFGTVSFVRVRPGFVGRGTDNGMPVLLLPGQHLYNEPNFQLLDFKSINENVITNGPINLVRIPPSMLGLATINKKPIILDAGMHFINSPGFEWQKCVSVNDTVIKNGPIAIIRVTPGNIGLASCSKKPVILGVGLHFINDPAFEFLRTQEVKETSIVQNGPISIVRIEPSTIGLATINKKPVILDSGMHFVFEPSFQFVGAQSVNDDVIQLGPVNIIRVKPGLIGLATINGRPTLLDVGVHFINEPSFKMEFFQKKTFVRVDEPIITLGTANVITVPRGCVAPVVVNGEGHFLLEGRHFIDQARFEMKKMKNLTDEYVCAGTRHRIVVPRGKLGLALEQGEPVLYEPGSVHLVNSQLFEYAGSVDVTQQVVAHGSIKIVTVKDGQVGITYNNGVLELLPTGRHTITAATHILAGFVSTGQQTLRIAEVTGMSLDNVELTFDAAICIRIVDAQKAVTMLTSGKGDIVQELQANVQERAKLDLSVIIGKSRLNKKHEATTAHKEVVDGADADGFEKVGGNASEPSGGFRTAIHDNFMVLFKQEMLNECGVDIINMAVEDVRIVDHELAKALASAAVANSNLERQTIEAEIVQVKASAEAKVARIDAEGKAAAMKIMARAEADRIQAVSDALGNACLPAQQQEAIRASGSALTTASTVLLAQDTGALCTLLGGAQGAQLSPPLRK